VYNKTKKLFMGSIKMCTGSTKMCLVITRHMAIGQSGKKRKQTVQKGPIADLTSSLRVRSWDLRRVPSNGLVGEGPRSHLLFVGTRSGLAFRGRKRTGASYKRLVLSCWERSETERERERERERVDPHKQQTCEVCMCLANAGEIAAGLGGLLCCV
jgi:hypothetical protein